MDDWTKAMLGRIFEAQTALQQQVNPTPEQALRSRARVPFQATRRNESLYVPPNGGPVRGRSVYTSPALDTHGYTLQNCFVQVRLTADSETAGNATRQLFVGVLEGSCNSPFCDIDEHIVMTTGGTATFQFPLLSSDSSFATTIRFVLYAADNRINPAVARIISFDLDGMLVAGLGYS